VPTENVVTPEIVRRLCWDWQPLQTSEDTASAIDEFLREAGVRQWQRELADPVLTDALYPDPSAQPGE
jgi:ribonuclease D